MHCPLCLQVYGGTLGVELARHWWQRMRDEPERDLERVLKDALFGSGEYEAGSRLREATSASTGIVEELLSRAKCHILAGRYHEAIEAADKAANSTHFTRAS